MSATGSVVPDAFLRPQLRDAMNPSPLGTAINLNTHPSFPDVFPQATAPWSQCILCVSSPDWPPRPTTVLYMYASFTVHPISRGVSTSLPRSLLRNCWPSVLFQMLHPRPLATSRVATIPTWSWCRLSLRPGGQAPVYGLLRSPTTTTNKRRQQPCTCITTCPLNWPLPSLPPSV